MSKLPSLDQKRAAYAWQVVQGQSDEYGKLAKGAPALIMNNGLMQTLAFYREKGKDKERSPHHMLNAHIIAWLSLTDKDGDTFDSLMCKLLDADSETYRKATVETLGLLRWIRQFAAIAR
jgi:CRISPR-associated protein Cmr5